MVNHRASLSTAQRARRRRSGGAAMVEMAIILPLLMVLVFGVIEYGWLFLRASHVNNAARQGARVAIRPAADDGEVENAVAQVMEQANLQDADYSVVTDGIELNPGEPVTVTVELTYGDDMSLTGFGMLPMPSSVRGTATMAKEGPIEDEDDE